MSGYRNTGLTRDDRIESYYQESARQLAEYLVDAEDEIEMWKAKIAELVDERLTGGK